MIRVDCGEMTVDDQLALAAAISDGLSGRGVALIKDDGIVLDAMTGSIEADAVSALVRVFVSRRKEPQYYSVESKGDEILVHTPDPLARSRGSKDAGQMLPDNLLKCPYASCGFVTPYPEVMRNHVLIHGI